MAARLQIPGHDNLPAQFLKREGDFGDRWKDKRISMRAKRRHLQSISF